MDSKDLVFITNENNKIISGGFEIKSDFLQNGGCIIPYGLLYHDKQKETMSIFDDLNSTIEDDLYDRLLGLAMYEKPKNKTRYNKKITNHGKTKKRK